MNDTRRRAEGEYAILDQIAGEPAPAGHLQNEAVKRAVVAAADENGGEVTAATVRPHVPAWVEPHRVGAVISALVKSGALIDTGRVQRSGQAKNRNRTKRLPVYALSALAVA